MPTTPSDAEVLIAAIDSRLLDVHTSMPGVVESYDKKTRTANIRPQIKRALEVEGEPEPAFEELPVIQNVPVGWPMGGGYFIHLPIEKGDHVWIMVSEAGLSQWRSSGKLSEPGDLRRHSLGNSWAYPGCAPDTKIVADLADPTFPEGLVIGKDGEANVRIKDGLVYIGRDADKFLALAQLVMTEIGRLRDTTSNAIGLITASGINTAAAVSAMNAHVVGDVSSTTAVAK